VIVTMEGTTSSKIGKKLQQLRDDGGVVALGRVLTLIIETNTSHLEEAVTAANGASRLHPSRVIVLANDTSDSGKSSRLDAEIRIGGDAGASEVIIIRAYGDARNNSESIVTGLMLPDAPVVAWWPSGSEQNPSSNPIGAIASKRITDSAVQSAPGKYLDQLAANYVPGDGDLAWTRITLWRSQLAALFDRHLDQAVTGITVFGAANSPSAELLAQWLSTNLGHSAEVVSSFEGDSIDGILGVEVSFEVGALSVIRDGDVAVIRQIGSPDSSVLLPKRSDQDCLSEDMRFLGEDEVYGEVLTARLKA